MTRRMFLRGSAVAAFGAGGAPLWLRRAVAAYRPSKRVLVAVFQRGAADGLNIVAPFGDKQYYALRPSLAVPQGAVIDLDGFFGLHPSLAGLKPVWDARQLAIVHAAGSPDPTRSHFDAQDYMESGTPGLKATADGWLNRAIEDGGGEPSPARALALGTALPRVLRGHEPALAIASLSEFQLRGPTAPFESLYEESPERTLAAGKETFEAVALLQSLERSRYTPANGAEYPRTRFGDNLRQIAQLIKSRAGLEVAFTDIGGWDHHVNEVGRGATEGQLANLLSDFGGSLAAFWRDLGERMADVTVVTMSEFGRTAHENGTRGTDHGHGNVMFILGGGVRGGRVYGKWPGLEREQLYESRDLDVTTDFRDVLGELVMKRLGNGDLGTVFPGYAAGPETFRGLANA